MEAESSSKGKELTLLLVGKTGNGKSSTGNTILQGGGNVTGGRHTFSTAVGFNSNTIEMEVEKCQRRGRSIKVINTPDLNMVTNEESSKKATKKQETKKKKKTSRREEEEEEEEEVGKWIAEGPIDAVVLVIRADCRYTREEFEIYQQLKKALERKMKATKPGYTIGDNLVVVFTMGDCLNGRDLRKDLQDASPELREVLKDAGSRYVVFDNRAEPWEREASVGTLLQVVDTMKPHPFPQQVCRLLLDGEEKLQQAIAAMLCPQADDRGLSRFFYFSYGPRKGSLPKHEFDGLKLEVALTPAGREDVETRTSIYRSVSPGPHVALYITTPDIVDVLPTSSRHQSKLQTYPKHRLLVVVDEGTPAVPEADLKQKLSEFLDSHKILVLRDYSETSREKLLSEVRKLVTSNEGQHFRNPEMDQLADKLQDQLSDKLQVTYQDYMNLKRRHFDSKAK